MPPTEKPELVLEQIIEIRDPEIDVEEVMARIRANVARRRAEGAYQEDLDTIADEVFATVVSARPADEIKAGILAVTLSELESHWMIREQPFVSHVPVLGALIVAVRSLWNWMSTKWYVRPLLQQQVLFNALVARAFLEMSTEQQVLAEKMQQFEEASREQREEIRRLRKQIRSLQEPRSSHGDLEKGEVS
jgi:O-antigen chain-terminating methyltransferase